VEVKTVYSNNLTWAPYRLLSATRHFDLVWNPSVISAGQSVNTVISDVLKEQGDALLPVLAERSRIVDDHRDQAFPELREHALSINDWSGWVFGTAAADAADIARGPLLDKRASA
jgi:hypothetical protein